jgi:tetratricopeptide (TPR) repeat protein
MALGDERMKQGNFLGAAFQYERAVEKDSTFVEGYYKLARAYIEAGRTYHDYLLQAEAVYGKLATLVDREDTEYRRNYAGFLLAKWDMDAAIIIFEELVAQSPQDCLEWVALGDAERAKGLAIQETQGLEASVSQLEKAEKTFRQAMEICPDRFEPVVGLARVLDARKQYREVATLYKTYWEKYPENVDMLRGLAYAYFNSRDWETSAKYLGELIRKDPKPEDRLVYISALRKVDRLDEAEEQGRLYKAEAPQLQGPVQLLPVDVLREELGIRRDSEQAVAFLEQGKCEEAVQVWRGSRSRVEARLEDPEFGEAAEELIVWLDRRILYAEGKCK